MNKITPHLWYDKEAREAAEFYCSVFPNSKITTISKLYNTPSGDTDIVSFTLMGKNFMAISAGPHFKFNPSISFIVNFDPSKDLPAQAGKDADKSIDSVWGKLLDGGKVLMEIKEYPWSKRYGWVQDKYGLSWQLIVTNPEGEERPEIVPALLFTGDVFGKAEEAVNFYLSVFSDKGSSTFGERSSKMGTIMKYGLGQEPNVEGTVMFCDFKLLDAWFAAMDGKGEHDFKFNEAVSFMVYCKDQEEIDYYWEKLSAVQESEQCGWLKDRYGVSWQIVPIEMDKMMAEGTKEQINRLTQTFLPMKKLIIADLKKAYEEK